jgi:hypothetical protein
MIAEVTIRIDLDEGEDEDPNEIAQDIVQESSDFLSQYGPILIVRVVLSEDGKTIADTSAPRAAEKPKAKKNRKAVKVSPDQDPDARFFIADLPAELPKPVTPRHRSVKAKGVPQ